MEEIKTGSYIRTKGGYIFQVTGQSKQDGHTIYDTDNFGICSDTFLEDIIKKQSKNIIDLIEEGDYVNEWQVLDKYLFAGEKLVLETSGEGTNCKCLTNEDIKNVVTKELFNLKKYIRR